MNIVREALSFAENGDFVQAVEKFRIAIQKPELLSDVSKVFDQFAQCLSILGQDDEAFEVARISLEANPVNVTSLETFAHCARNVGHLEAAISALKKGISRLLCLNSSIGYNFEADHELLVALRLELAEVASLLRRKRVQQLGFPSLVLSEGGYENLDHHQSNEYVSQAVGESGLCHAGPSFLIWDAGLELIKQACATSQQRLSFKGKRILELGSGTGIAGIALALCGAHVTLTDAPNAVPFLMHNVRQNEEGIRYNGGSADVVAFKWEDVESWEYYDAKEENEKNKTDVKRQEDGEMNDSKGRWDLIIGSDLVYSESQIEPLTNALVSLTQGRNKKCVILLAHKHRHVDVDQCLLRQFKSKGFSVEFDISKFGFTLETYNSDEGGLDRIMTTPQNAMSSDASNDSFIGRRTISISAFIRKQ